MTNDDPFALLNTDILKDTNAIKKTSKNDDLAAITKAAESAGFKNRSADQQPIIPKKEWRENKTISILESDSAELERVYEMMKNTNPRWIANRSNVYRAALHCFKRLPAEDQVLALQDYNARIKR
jgi:hypothetical protein